MINLAAIELDIFADDNDFDGAVRELVSGLNITYALITPRTAHSWPVYQFIAPYSELIALLTRYSDDASLAGEIIVV